MEFELDKSAKATNRIILDRVTETKVITYSFNIIIWSVSEMKKVYAKIRKLLTMHRMHHQKSEIDQLYIPRRGIRALIQL